MPPRKKVTKSEVIEDRVLVDPAQLVIDKVLHENSVYPGSSHESRFCPGYPSCSFAKRPETLTPQQQYSELMKFGDVASGQTGNRHLAWYGQCRAKEMPHREAIIDMVLNYNLWLSDWWAKRFPNGCDIPEIQAKRDDFERRYPRA